MSNIEEHLIAELERQSDAVPTLRGNLDKVRRSGRRRLFARRAGTTTAAAFAVALALGPIALLSDGGTELDAVQGGGVSGLSLSGQTTVTTTTMQTTTTDVDGVAGSAGIDVDVASAVAPFDHESNVDSRLLGKLLVSFGAEGLQYLSDCMTEEGFDGPGPRVLPSRDDPMLISNWQFPPIAMLAAEGFAVLPGTPSSPEDFVEHPERDAASRSCSAKTEERFLATDNARASELYGTLRGAWEEVLTDIDASDEVGLLVAGFGSCLVDEGIPVEFTVSLDRYLGYVDSLRVGADDDAAKLAEIHEQYGKLYAECGTNLFTAREQLRSGERRTEFLDEHADAISELSDLLGSSG